MTQAEILTFLNQYGLWFMFLVVFMEYLNLPGFPAGVIFPAVGLWAKVAEISFVAAFGLSILAGLLGSMILYLVGRYGGIRFVNKIYGKYPKIQRRMTAFEEKMRHREGTTVFVAKLIPVMRTLIGFPAGIIQMNIPKYLVFSAFGIAIWNGVLMFSGTIIGWFI